MIRERKFAADNSQLLNKIRLYIGLDFLTNIRFDHSLMFHFSLIV